MPRHQGTALSSVPCVPLTCSLNGEPELSMLDFLRPLGSHPFSHLFTRDSDAALVVFWTGHDTSLERLEPTTSLRGRTEPTSSHFLKERSQFNLPIDRYSLTSNSSR
jgi:hypothetical protein